MIFFPCSSGCWKSKIKELIDSAPAESYFLIYGQSSGCVLTLPFCLSLLRAPIPSWQVGGPNLNLITYPTSKCYHTEAGASTYESVGSTQAFIVVVSPAGPSVRWKCEPLNKSKKKVPLKVLTYETFPFLLQSLLTRHSVFLATWWHIPLGMGMLVGWM